MTSNQAQSKPSLEELGKSIQRYVFDSCMQKRKFADYEVAFTKVASMLIGI